MRLEQPGWLLSNQPIKPSSCARDEAGSWHHEFMLRVSYGQFRTRSLTDDFFCNTAHQHVGDWSPAVRAQHNQVDVVRLGILDDFDKRRTSRGHDLDMGLQWLPVRQKTFQPIASLRFER